MYATRRFYVKQWDHQSADERYTVQVARGGKPVPGLQPERIAAVEEEVMYWRKANHIHTWFVDNVQYGEDNCREYEVPCEVLRQLLSVCKKVIKASKLVDGMVWMGTYWAPGMDKAEERREPGKVIQDPTVAKALLPTRDGCFFGNIEYDEEYLDEVVRTRDWAASMLADCKAGVPGDITYRASW